MSDEPPTRVRGVLIGPLPEPDGIDQAAVDDAIASLEERDRP
ncbi:MAG: hypothetical protein V5A27_10180 [Halapricum sp.]